MTRLSAALGLLALVGLLAVPGAGCRLDWSLDPAAGVSDAGPPPEPAVDGAGGGFSCDGALFCTGFDEGRVTPAWTDTILSANGTLRVEPFASAPSSPDVLFAARPAADVPPNSAYVTRVLAQPLSRMSLRFAIRPEQLDPTKRACVAGIVLGDGTGAEHLFRILLGVDGGVLQDRTTTTQTYPLTAAPPPGQWTEMTLTVDLGGRTSVRVGGAVVLDIATSGSAAASMSTRVFLGINFVETPQQGFAFRFDDVRFDGS